MPVAGGRKQAAGHQGGSSEIKEGDGENDLELQQK